MALRDLDTGDPARVGPYRLTGRLGSGGMGVVYLGFGPDGEPAAVKTLRVGADAGARERLRREADHMAGVTSPRVARLLASDVDAEVPWLASAYVPGPALSEVPVPLPEAAVRTLAAGLAEALEAIAAAGIVHRDLKPANVILAYDGPVLVDLGIARMGFAAGLTEVGTVLGSPAWMAPEQLRGEPATPAFDVWAWGAVVAYAATGRCPFGEGEFEGLAWRIQTAEPHLDGLPGDLLPRVRAALAKHPAQRPVAGALLAAAAGASTVRVPVVEPTRTWYAPPQPPTLVAAPAAAPPPPAPPAGPVPAPYAPPAAAATRFPPVRAPRQPAPPRNPLAGLRDPWAPAPQTPKPQTSKLSTPPTTRQRAPRSPSPWRRRWTRRLVHLAVVVALAAVLAWVLIDRGVLPPGATGPVVLVVVGAAVAMWLRRVLVRLVLLGALSALAVGIYWLMTSMR